MLEDLGQHYWTTLPTECDVSTNAGNSPRRRQKPDHLDMHSSHQGVWRKMIRFPLSLLPRASDRGLPFSGGGRTTFFFSFPIRFIQPDSAGRQHTRWGGLDRRTAGDRSRTRRSRHNSWPTREPMPFEERPACARGGRAGRLPYRIHTRLRANAGPSLQIIGTGYRYPGLRSRIRSAEQKTLARFLMTGDLRVC